MWKSNRLLKKAFHNIYNSYYYYCCCLLLWLAQFTVNHKSLINAPGQLSTEAVGPCEASIPPGPLFFNKSLISTQHSSGWHVTSQLMFLSSFAAKMISRVKTRLSWSVFSPFLHSGISLDFVKVPGHRNSRRRWGSDTHEHRTYTHNTWTHKYENSRK